MSNAAVHRGAAAALALSAVLSVVFVLYDAGVVDGSEDVFWKGVYNGALALAALAVLWRAVRVPRERLPWILLGLALLSWTAGEVYWSVALADLAATPVPSWADAGWLATYPLAYAGIILLIRARMPGLRGGLWLDGLIGGLAIAAVGAAAVVPLITGGSFGDVLMNAAYPVGDLVLLGMIGFGLTVDGWHVARSWSLLAAGFAVFAVTDSLWLWQTVRGGDALMVALDAGWLVAAMLVGAAALLPLPAERPRAQDGRRLILVPSAFGLVGLGLLVWGGLASVDRLALVLATLCLAAVIARMALTYSHSVRESLTDALTGLPNRRRLARDLRERAPSARPDRLLGIAFFDLNGFKRYNDAFGHPAGDALLVLLSRRLSAAIAGAGTAYRMGGDEFCALFEGTRPQIDAALLRVLAALTETGDGFAIDAAHGLVVMPDEESEPDRALGLADQRMYALKHGVRPAGAREVGDALAQVLLERDPGAGDHADGVAELARATALRLGLDDEHARDVSLAARLRDVGTAAVPDEILRKPGPLDPDEREVMERHPAIGERILRAAPSLAGVAPLVRASHERWDGCGYPDRLAGEAVPLGARVVAVCAAFDAIITPRPWAPPLSPRRAVQELRAGSGSQFDPRVVEAFTAVLAERALRPGDAPRMRDVPGDSPTAA